MKESTAKMIDNTLNHETRKIRIKLYLMVGIINDVFYIGTGSKLQFTISSPPLIKRVRELLPYLQGDYSVSEILTEWDKSHAEHEELNSPGNSDVLTIREIINCFFENDILEYVDSGSHEDFSNDEYEMYSRNLLFYDMFTTVGMKAIDYQRILKNSHIVIFGLHGVGAQALLMSNQSGIGHITGIDSGVVDKFHLNSKVLYQFKDIGKDKGEVLSERIKELNPYTTFEYLDYNKTVKGRSQIIEDAIAGADCVIFCLDLISGAAEIAQNICIPHKIPYVIVGKRQSIGFVGPFFIPGKSVCYLCDEKLSQEIWEHKPSEPGIAKKIFSFNNEIVFSPIDTLLGNYAVADVIRYLTHFEKLSLLNKQFLYDERYYLLSNKSIYRNFECRNCKEENHPDSELLLKLNDRLSLFDTSILEFMDFIAHKDNNLSNRSEDPRKYVVTAEGKKICLHLSKEERELLILLRKGHSYKNAISILNEHFDKRIDMVSFFSLLIFAHLVKCIDGYPVRETDLLSYENLFVKMCDYVTGKEGSYYTIAKAGEEKILLPEASMRTVDLIARGMSIDKVKKTIMEEFSVTSLNIAPLIETLFEKGFIEYIKIMEV